MRIRPLPTVGHSKPDGRRAFTLMEMLVGTALLVILLGGAVASHIYGMLMLETNSAKASASAEARRNITTLMSEVCSAKNVAVGDGNATSFSQVGADIPQRGPALQIYPNSDTNSYIRYFLDPVAQTFNRMTNGAASVVMAGGVSNSVLFTLEDFAGNLLSNSQNSAVVGLTLQYYQVQSPAWTVGPTGVYSSYQVRSKIARRSF